MALTQLLFTPTLGEFVSHSDCSAIGHGEPHLAAASWWGEFGGEGEGEVRVRRLRGEGVEVGKGVVGGEVGIKR